jgi:hypothetical protein
MKQKEAVAISRALKKVEVQRERQLIIQASIDAGLREVPEIDRAMEPMVLSIDNFGETSARELAIALVLCLTKKGYYEGEQ